MHNQKHTPSVNNKRDRLSYLWLAVAQRLLRLDPLQEAIYRRKAVLDSRAAARRYHVTNRLQQGWRNVGFRVGNLFIQGFSCRNAPSKQRR